MRKLSAGPNRGLGGLIRRLAEGGVSPQAAHQLAKSRLNQVPTIDDLLAGVAKNGPVSARAKLNPVARHDLGMLGADAGVSRFASPATVGATRIPPKAIAREQGLSLHDKARGAQGPTPYLESLVKRKELASRRPSVFKPQPASSEAPVVQHSGRPFRQPVTVSSLLQRTANKHKLLTGSAIAAGAAAPVYGATAAIDHMLSPSAAPVPSNQKLPAGPAVNPTPPSFPSPSPAADAPLPLPDTQQLPTLTRELEMPSIARRRAARRSAGSVLQSRSSSAAQTSPPSPTATTPESSDWLSTAIKYAPHAALAGAGGLGLYSLYNQMNRKDREQDSVKLASFVDAYPLVAGFLSACHEAGLDDQQITEKIAEACQADSMIAREFSCAMQKSAILDEALAPFVPSPKLGPAAGKPLSVPPVNAKPPLDVKPPVLPHASIPNATPNLSFAQTEAMQPKLQQPKDFWQRLQDRAVGAGGAVAATAGSIGGEIAKPFAYLGERAGVLPEGSHAGVTDFQNQMHNHANAAGSQFVHANDAYYLSAQNALDSMPEGRPKTVAGVYQTVGQGAARAVPYALGGKALGTVGKGFMPAAGQAASPLQQAGQFGTGMADLSVGYAGGLNAARQPSTELAQLAASPEGQSQLAADSGQPTPQPAGNAGMPAEAISEHQNRGLRPIDTAKVPGSEPPVPPADMGQAPPPAPDAPVEQWSQYVDGIVDNPNTPMNEKFEVMKPFAEQVAKANGASVDEMASFVAQIEKDGLPPDKLQEAFKKFQAQQTGGQANATLDLQAQGTQLWDQFSQLDPGTQAMIGLGFGMGAIGLMHMMSNGGSMSSALMALLGFGAAAGLAGHSGLFGEGVQQGMHGAMGDVQSLLSGPGAEPPPLPDTKGLPTLDPLPETGGPNAPPVPPADGVPAAGPTPTDPVAQLSAQPFAQRAQSMGIPDGSPDKWTSDQQQQALKALESASARYSPEQLMKLVQGMPPDQAKMMLEKIQANPARTIPVIGTKIPGFSPAATDELSGVLKQYLASPQPNQTSMIRQPKLDAYEQLRAGSNPNIPA